MTKPPTYGRAGIPPARTVRNYIDGEREVSEGGDSLALDNPATGEHLGTVPFSTPSEGDEAVATAQEAFEGWRDRPVEERIQPLFRLKELLEAHQEELAELLVQDHGKTLGVKPSEQDPLVPQRIFELIDEAGFPDGVLQLVDGGPDTVTALLEHPGVAGVSFVESTPVAEYIYETAAANGKRVQTQGGAKNHVIVSESADLEFAAEKTGSSAFAYGGERCLANDITLVEESVYEEFVDLALAATDEQVLGNGLDEETTIGALITPDHEQSVRNYIQTGVEEGAELLRDGRDVTVDGAEDGNFLGPTVFGDVTEDMAIAQEELFGPVLGIAPVADLDDAIARLNRSEFGNAASLSTDRGSEARRFRNQAEAGNLGVNVGTVAPMAFFHFGGRKSSFFGDLHVQGEDMIRFYTDETIYIECWPGA